MTEPTYKVDLLGLRPSRQLIMVIIQKMKLQFKSIIDQEAGILASLLFQSYADLIKENPIPWKPEENNWKEFDRDAFGNPETVGACVFLSWHGSELIGFASFDLRKAPKIGIIGHNCILPEFRGQGFGKDALDQINYTLNGMRRSFVQGQLGGKYVPNWTYQAENNLTAGLLAYITNPKYAATTFRQSIMPFKVPLNDISMAARTRGADRYGWTANNN